jgi:hypothetical protein
LALAQRKSTVENKVTEEAVETEVIEEAVEIHDFSIDFTMSLETKLADATPTNTSQSCMASSRVCL